VVSIEANIETTGGEEIQRVLREAGERQADLTGAWMQIQKQFQEEQAEVFSASGAAGGSTRAVGKWWLGVLHHIGAGHLPKRKAIRVTPRQEKRWGDIIGRWLEGGE